MRADSGHRQPRAVAWLTAHGAIDGTDWRVGDSRQAWDGPCVVDTGSTIGINDDVHPVDLEALPVLVRSSAVRLLGGQLTAEKMDAGEFPAEMPFALEPYGLGRDLS